VGATDENAAAPAGSGNIKTLGVGLGLLAVALCILTPLFYGSSTFAAADRLALRYKLGELPPAYSLEESGILLPGGERIFVFSGGEEGADSVGEFLVTETDDSVATEADESTNRSAEDHIDWSKVEPLSEGSAPSRLFLVHYPTSRAKAVIDAHFRRLEWKDLRSIEPKGGSTAVDGGKLEWNGFGADYVQVRSFISGGAFRDVLRVNLSLEDECWVAYAVWPELHAGSKEPVQELLASLQPTSF
jgi:hypothetical protein